MLSDLWGWLRGRKSYLLGFALIVVAGLYAQGYITEQTWRALTTLLGGGTAMALRAAIAKGPGKR